MRIGIIGSGHIGGMLGKIWASAGHQVMFSFSRDQEKLRQLASEAGHQAMFGSPANAKEFADVVLFSVPWVTIPEALRQTGSLSGKIVIDTTNQFGAVGEHAIPSGKTAFGFNVERILGAKMAKAFNTLTAGFQAKAHQRPVNGQSAMFYVSENVDANNACAKLIEDTGFVPIDLGGKDEVHIMEAPRRKGAVYGEEYTPQSARAIAAAIKIDPKLAGQLAADTHVS
jgi:8-hydroxy-5-deazaflavin:NADPH oxidoreductase